MDVFKNLPDDENNVIIKARIFMHIKVSKHAI